MAEVQARKPVRKGVRPIHRILGSILLIFTLYIATTGSLIQMVDLKAVLSHAAATDPEMMAIRESIDGTPNYSVITAADYLAPSLPDGFDFNAALANVLKGARQAAGDGADLKYLELRMLNGQPIGLVQAAAGKDNRIIRVNPATGTVLPNPPPAPRERRVQSWHDTFKSWHRFQSFNLPDAGQAFNALIGIGLFVMIMTGLVLYFQLLRARSRAGLKAIFWSSGGWWRSMHRGVSIVAALFLVVVSISGTALSIDSSFLGFYMDAHQKPGARQRQFPAGMIGDESSPLPDAQLPAMLQTTLSSYQADGGKMPIKVLRLRYYSGMPQGLILYGNSDDTEQVVFNTATGQRTSTTEPGYAFTGFPFGWKEHELMKEIHRGDILGVPGRFMDLFAAFSLMFLSISGLVMYLNLWKGRRRGGHSSPFWT